MANIYDSQRIGKLIFIIISAVIISIFLIVSNNLIEELSHQERIRMEIWADATKRLANADENTDFDYLLSIIQRNNSIPVLVEDGQGNILNHRNFDLPVKGEEETLIFSELSPQNQVYLNDKLKSLRNSSNMIVLDIDADNRQYIYYEDSIVLTRLSYYPYIQLGVMIVIALIIFSAILYTKRAEQNRVWVGLSKETAHQLGTPISSLMAWTQLLEAYGVENDVVKEIDKDVHRLSVIADRFSKIGSKPELQLEYLNDTIGRSLEYMRSRVSGKVNIIMDLSDDDHGVMLSVPLFEWVMENLTKNAVDAMDGAGTITIRTLADHQRVAIEVSDTGKGILRKNFKNVFHPGFTTKKRGWGLGLTLVKRIIEEYHEGKIFVKESEIGRGTTFRIELPSPKNDR
mgnify:FL=1